MSYQINILQTDGLDQESSIYLTKKKSLFSTVTLSFKNIFNSLLEKSEATATTNSFKYNLLDPAGRVFTTDNGDIKILLAIEYGPVLAFHFNDGIETIYEAKFTGEKFTGYASKDGKKYTQSYINSTYVDVPIKGANGINWNMLTVTAYMDPVSTLKTFKCNDCSNDGNNSSPAIGVIPVNYTDPAQVFLWKDLIANKISSGKYLLHRECAVSNANVLSYEEGTFASEQVHFIKSSPVVYDFSSYVYPSSSAFGTNVVDPTVVAQLKLLKANTNKLDKTVILTKEKNVITYNTETSKYEIRTLTPFDKSSINLSTTSDQVVCIQNSNNTYNIQIGGARKSALAQKYLGNADAGTLTKFGDFLTEYGKGLVFFGNEYNKAWTEIADLLEDVTETYASASLTNYKCSSIEFYKNGGDENGVYKEGNYTKYWSFVLLSYGSFTGFSTDKTTVVVFSTVDKNILCATGMGLWNSIVAIPSDIVSGTAAVSSVFSSTQWSAGTTAAKEYFDKPDLIDPVIKWGANVGNKIYEKASQADACELAYFGGQVVGLVTAAIVAPEGLGEKLAGMALKAAVKIPGLSSRVIGKILSYTSKVNNIDVVVIEITESSFKLRRSGNLVEITDQTLLDDFSQALEGGDVTKGPQGDILINDDDLSSRIDKFVGEAEKLFATSGDELLSLGKNIFKGSDEMFQLAKTKIADYRIEMKGKKKLGGNLGYVEGEINGIKLDDNLVSSTTVPASAPEIFEAKYVNGQNQIKPSGIDGAYLRTGDSEFQMLTDVAQKFNLEKGTVYSSYTGTIKVISELPYCASCSGVIQQFSVMLPSVKIIIVNGTK